MTHIKFSKVYNKGMKCGIAVGGATMYIYSNTYERPSIFAESLRRKMKEKIKIFIRNVCRLKIIIYLCNPFRAERKSSLKILER
ncbi:MAG TPA: hypothetical protein DHU75_05760 [Rikenellaceae bacterium]|nr:hypothetical protein [Rikenellaceae bacterium]